MGEEPAGRPLKGRRVCGPDGPELATGAAEEGGRGNARPAEMAPRMRPGARGSAPEGRAWEERV